MIHYITTHQGDRYAEFSVEVWHHEALAKNWYESDLKDYNESHVEYGGEKPTFVAVEMDCFKAHVQILDGVIETTVKVHGVEVDTCQYERKLGQVWWTEVCEVKPIEWRDNWDTSRVVALGLSANTPGGKF